MLIDLNCYKPNLVVDEKPVAPEELGLHQEIPDWEHYGEKVMEELYTLKKTLQKPAILPNKARFKEGKAVHLQFDGGCQHGNGAGGFVIIDAEGKEVIRGGRYFSKASTSNEAESEPLEKP